MVDNDNLPEEFAPTREHEYQDAHYHDEEPEIVNDEQHGSVKPAPKKKLRIPPPRRRHFED